MNLICEDNSYRSTLGALDFTVALQAEIGGDTRHQWVERAELDKVENELHLSAFGQIDRTEAIRGGRWVKADWAVFGRISTNDANGRSLNLEVVDLQHADALAETNLTLAPQTNTYFYVAKDGITPAGSALRSLLARADRAAREARAENGGGVDFSLARRSRRSRICFDGGRLRKGARRLRDYWKADSFHSI